MKFEDLKLIQQIAILSNMIETPNTTRKPENEIYRVPDTDFVIDIMDVYTTTDVYMPLESNEDDGFDVNFTAFYNPEEEEERVTLEFVIGQDYASESPIDKFGLLAGMSLRGELGPALKKIIEVVGTLTNLGFVKNNPTGILTRMLELIPVAKSLPSELFESVYIDPIGTNTVKVIHESMNAALITYEKEYLKQGIIIPDFAYGHRVLHGDPVVNDTARELDLTVNYGIIGLNNIIVFEVSGYDGEGFVRNTLASKKVTSLDSPESILDGLKKDVYDALDKNENKTYLLPLVDAYFDIMDKARTDITGRLMPF